MSNVRYIFSIGKFFLSCLLLCFVFSQEIEAAWTSYVIDTAANASPGASIDIDSNGQAHISYSRGSLLEYAKYNGTDWIIQTVDSNWSYNTSVELALDGDGYARISYLNNELMGYGSLKYAYFNGTGWVKQTVDASGEMTVGPSLALNASGYARIAYKDIDLGLKYAEFNGTGWTTQFVQGGGSIWAQYPSIALDSSGYARIAYSDSPAGEGYLKYASYNGTTWVIQTVDSTQVENGQQSSLALTSGGYGRISYIDYTSEMLKYASFNGTGWVLQDIESIGLAGSNTSLALDSQGYGYISYVYSEIIGYDTEDPPQPIYRWDLKLAHFNGSGWDIETLVSDIGSGGGTDTSLAVYNDYVYVLYGKSGLNLIANGPLSSGMVPEPATDILGKIIFISLPFFWLGGSSRKPH